MAGEPASRGMVCVGTPLLPSIPSRQGLCVLRDGDTEQGERGIGIPAIEA
jgi:hypothetical protein